MTDLITLIALTLIAGGSIPLGGSLACVDSLYPAWLTSESRHGIMAFGGGALMSAVALVLVPEGCDKLTAGSAGVAFALGGVAFLGLDLWLARHDSPAGQLTAMLSDFVPEAMALGAAIALNQSTGPLLAMLIAIQNIPEGFNAYRELAESGRFRGRIIIFIFSLMALLGPLAGFVGYFLLAESPAILGVIMLFASGGILYIVFQDIAPNAKIQQRWAPALGAVAGFLLGLLGHMLLK